MTFTDNVVLITGGSSGIGLQAAIEIARQGARELVIVGRDPDRGRAAMESVAAAAGVKPDFVPCDLMDPRSAVGLIEDVIARYGRLDVMVNSLNSGSLPQLLHNSDIAEAGDVLLGRCLGTIHASLAALMVMRRQGKGSIVNVASDAAKVPTPGEAIIGAGMAAIVTFSKTMAVEAKRDGVRVNVVTPSLVTDTGGYDMVMSDAFSSRLFGKAVDRASLGLTEASDVARLIAFLAGPDAARITGQAVSVNGGISVA